MAPVLFTIGSYNVYAFGFFLALSFVLSSFFVWKLSRDELKEEEFLDAFLYTSLSILICARIGYIFLHLDQFGLNVLKYILVRETPGLSLFSGIVGGFGFLMWYAKRKKLPLDHLLDILSIAASWGLVFVKIGQQLGGAGFGKETNLFIAVRIAGIAGKHHPVEAYETLVFFLSSIFLWIIYNKARIEKWPQGIVFLIFCLILLSSIFLLEFLKLNPVYLIGLSQKQIAVVLTMLPVGYYFIKSIKIIRRSKQ